MVSDDYYGEETGAEESDATPSLQKDETQLGSDEYGEEVEEGDILPQSGDKPLSQQEMMRQVMAKVQENLAGVLKSGATRKEALHALERAVGGDKPEDPLKNFKGEKTKGFKAVEGDERQARHVREKLAAEHEFQEIDERHFYLNQG